MALFSGVLATNGVFASGVDSRRYAYGSRVK